MIDQILGRLRRNRAAVDTHVRPSRDVLTAERDGLAVLLDLKHAVYFGLDEVGTTAWHEIESGTNIESVVSRVCTEYDAPPDAVQSDIERFIGELRRYKLVVSA